MLGSCFGWVVLVVVCLLLLRWTIGSICKAFGGGPAGRAQSNTSRQTGSRTRYLPKRTDRRIVVKKDGKLKRFALNKYGEIFEES